MADANVKYWIEGEQEVLQTMLEAIDNCNDFSAEDALKRLGINTENYETSQVCWGHPKMLEKDGNKVLYFEEVCPYELSPYENGTIIEQLMDEKPFTGKLSNFYFYVGAGELDTFITNDWGKYFPYRIVAQIVGKDGYCVDEFYALDKQQLVSEICDKYNLPDNLDSLDDLFSYFDDSEEYDYLYVHGVFVSVKHVKKREERELKHNS